MEAQRRQILCNSVVELGSLGLLQIQFRDQSLHLLVERFSIIRLGCRANVAAGGQDMALLPYIVELGAPAEARDVLVGVRAIAPIVVCPRNAGDVFVPIFGGLLAPFGQQGRPALLKGVGYVLEED